MDFWAFLVRLLSPPAPPVPPIQAAPVPAPPPAPAPAAPPAPAGPAAATGPRGTKGVQSRSWRNRSAGNLRIRSTKPPVDHVAVDNDPRGPYGIYGSERDGWADLAARVIQLWDEGVRTIGPIVAKPVTQREKGIIWVWAPPEDGNHTNVYIDGVAKALGVGTKQPIPDPRDIAVMRIIADAIRRHEGLGSDPAWDPAQREAGFRLAGCVTKERV